jgi:ribonuclease J
LSNPSHLEIVPLGGLGEFGMNLMVYRWGSDCLIVDAGMMFPGEDHLGINVVIPDLSFLDDCGTLHGVVLTHGHEDHVGALPYLLARHDLPVHATPFTEGLIRNRLSEHDRLRGAALRPLPDDRPLELGPFGVESIVAAHSIPQSRMLLIRTPVGNVVHATDFKLDPDPPDGVTTDLERLERIGDDGVLLLLSDSTNADHPGRTPGERQVVEGIERCVAGRSGRVVVTTFASHVQRLRELALLARRHSRTMALVGASLVKHAAVADRLGLIGDPPGTRATVERVMDLPPRRGLIVASGSQGEPMSAMSRIALGTHRQVQIGKGDLVIHSARRIPGNEKSIGRMINYLLRRGAEVVTSAEARVHASGHAAMDDLQQLLQAVRPTFFVPIHGEYRQLSAHAGLARDAGLPHGRVLLADSGDVIAVDDRSISVVGRVHVGQVFIDATLEEVDLTILRDRRRIAGDGLVVPVVAVHRESGAVNGTPEIVTRGFVPIGQEGDRKLMLEARQVVAESLAEATREERGDERLLRARIQTGLNRFLRRRTQRRPLVIPVIVEL